MPIGTIPTILLIAIIVNLAIMAVMLASVRRRRVRAEQMLLQLGLTAPWDGPAVEPQASTHAEGEALAVDLAEPPDVQEAEAPDVNEARAADLGEIEIDAHGSQNVAVLDQHVPPIEETGDESDPMSETQPARTRRFALPDHEDYPATESIEAFFAAGRPPSASRPVNGDDVATDDRAIDEDPLGDPTRIDGARAWASVLADEGARTARYHRPVSVVIAELDGLDRLVDFFGAEITERMLGPVADAFRGNGRATDQVARIGPSRFGVLLPETDEIQAINYVERVRWQVDRWLASVAVAARLSLGWASPASDGDLSAAVTRAEVRFQAEQRRPAPWSEVEARSEAGDDGAPTASADGATGSTETGSTEIGSSGSGSSGGHGPAQGLTMVSRAVPQA